MSEKMNPEESNIVNYLSVVGESVGDPTVVGLFNTADKVIDQFSEQTIFNALPAEKFSLPINVQIQNKNYEVGMTKVSGLIGESTTVSFNFRDADGSKEEEHLGVAFLTSNGVLFAPSSPGEHTEANHPEDIKLVAKILDKAQKVAAREQAEQWSAKRRRVHQRVAAVSIGLAGAATVGAIQLGVGDWFAYDETKFDRHEYTLPVEEATILKINEKGSPKFSETLQSNAALGEDKVPQLRESPPLLGDYPTDEQLSVDEGLRQITITSSENDGWSSDCRSTELEGVKDSTELFVWTDFVDENGQSRADELEVSLTEDEAKVCWNGEETSDEDDPRVIVDLR